MPEDQLLEAVSVGFTTLTCDVAYAAGCICTAYIVIASAARITFASRITATVVGIAAAAARVASCVTAAARVLRVTAAAVCSLS